MSIADAPQLSLEGTLLTVSPADLRAAPTRPLLLLLHGAGANERDLVPFAWLLPADFALAFLRGPVKRDDGYSWTLPLTPGADPHDTANRSADASAEAIERWLVRSGMDEPVRPLGLLGFSGGGATALHLLRRRPRRYFGTAILSAFVTGDPQEIGPEHRPKVYWATDPEDSVLGPSTIKNTVAWLRSRTELLAEEFPGTGHTPHEAAIRNASAFLQSAAPR